MMVFCDSFNLYTQAFMGDMWDIVQTGTVNRCTLAQSLTSGRFGSGGVTFAMGPTFDPALAYMQVNFDGKSTIICGLAVQQTATQNVGSVTSNVQGGRLLTFLDGASMQVGLNILPSGQIQAVRNTNAGEGPFPNVVPSLKTTTLSTSTNAVSASSYDFLEVKIIFATGSGGSIEILRNGEAFWNPTGLNTAVSGVANCSSIIVGGAIWETGGVDLGQPLQAIISDFHIVNTTVNGDDALDPVDFIGDRHWQAITPATDGTYTEWTPDPSVPGATEHTLNVETIPPDTAKNNNTETEGNRDSFNCDDATGPDAASVILAYVPYLQKNAGGAVGVSGIFRLSGADRNGTEFQAPNPYAYRHSFLCSKPGGGAITIADVNAGEHGYERTS